MRIVIIGTGYVGLTTGVALAFLGHDVTCVDNNSEKIESLQNGDIPFHEPSLSDLLKVSSSKIRFVTSYDEAGIDNCDVIFIAVGTPSMPDGSADLQYVKCVSEQIGYRLNNKYTVIVNKSTVPVGSGKLVHSLIQNTYSKKHSNQAGDSFSVVSNPEFLRQGSAVVDTLFPDRIVIGGDNQKAVDILIELYGQLIRQDFTPPDFINRPRECKFSNLVTCDLASAELIKYTANAFLALKISYINEIAGLASIVGADIKKISYGIGLDKRIGPKFLNAGIGWGGSCFGKDTSALISIGKDYGLEMPIITAARKVNYQQRSWIIDKLLTELDQFDGSTIALLGASFKPNTDDLREAPSIDIARSLSLLGANVNITDPVALPNVRKQHADLRLSYYENPIEALMSVDAVVLVTEWEEYKHIDWMQVKKVMKNPLIIDGRNFLDREQLTNLGFRYYGIGR